MIDNDMDHWQGIMFYAEKFGVGSSVVIQRETITVTAYKGSWLNDHKMATQEVRLANCDIVGIELMRIIKTVKDAYEEQS